MTQHPSATPEFRHVAQRLRDAVTGGTYEPGSRLPAAAELADHLGCTRSAVERAVRVAAAEGLVTTRKGSGAYVSRLLKRITRRTDFLLRSGPDGEADGSDDALEAELRTLGLVARHFPDVRTERAPQDLAAPLGLKRHGQVLVRETRTFAVAAGSAPADPGTPVQLAFAYLPLDIARHTDLEHPNLGPRGVQGLLAELGHRPTDFSETVDVRPPHEHEAAALEIDADNRVIQLIRTAATADRTVAVTVSVLPAHLWSLSYRWTTTA
ncbi:GntR family transcriptional regulator [Streptomyces sp. NPDC049950]|uniref:GntR family transcriptional regulator n=1 Tax=Streptomyces sp. NPDC049950 TaxID=3156659 RepID=UPI00343DA5B8